MLQMTQTRRAPGRILGRTEIHDSHRRYENGRSGTVDGQNTLSQFAPSRMLPADAVNRQRRMFDIDETESVVAADDDPASIGRVALP